MANQYWEVITVLDSDDETDSKAKAPATVGNAVKSQKPNARKSARSGMTNTAIKKEPCPTVSQSSVADSRNANHVQAAPSTSTENLVPPHKTARKSINNSNLPTTTKMVSILKNSSNLQSVPAHSVNVNGHACPTKLTRNVATSASKLNGITITPVPSLAAKTVLPTAQKLCNSGMPPVNVRASNNYFVPVATSTPKLSNAIRKKVAPGILASVRKTSSLVVTDKVKPCSLPATTVSTGSTGSSFKVPKMLPTGTTIKLAPRVSLQPVVEKGAHLKENITTGTEKSAQNSKSDVPVSLLACLGKTGVTITKASNGDVRSVQSNIKTNSKDKKAIHTERLNNHSMDNATSVGRTASKSNTNGVTKITSGIRNKDQSKNSLLKENFGIKSSIVITPVVIDNSNFNGKINQNHAKAQNVNSSHVETSKKEDINRKSTVQQATTTVKSVENCLKNIEKQKLPSIKNSGRMVKKMRLDKIVNSIKKTKLVINNENQMKPDSNISSQVSKDPLEVLRSNNDFTVLAGPSNQKHEINSNSVPSNTCASKGIGKQRSDGKNTRKRANSQTDFNKGVTNKKQKNETNANPTAAENLKRIAALKESLKKLSANSVNSKASTSAERDHLKPSGNKNNGDGIMATDDILKEKPFKQVTSPKLSLKRKRIEDQHNSSEKKARVDPARQNTQTIEHTPNNVPNSIHPRQADPHKVIPLPYVETTKDTRPQVDKNKAIPLPYFEPTNSAPNKLPAAHPKVDSNSVQNTILKNSTIQPSGSSTPKNKSDSSVPWSSTDDNTTKFKKLLEFSKTFMAATESEKCTIVKNFHKLLDRASPAYVNSAEFELLISDTLKKIKDSKDTFIHLQTIKTELKAYKRKKEQDTLHNSRHCSSSSEQSEATKFASNLGLAPSKPPNEVSEPIQVEHLASAIRSVTSNLKLNDSNASARNSYLLSDVPSTSKQADIVENFRLSMPAGNNGPSENDLRDIPMTSQQADIIDNLSLSMPGLFPGDSTNVRPTSKPLDVLSEQCSFSFNNKVNDSEDVPAASEHVLSENDTLQKQSTPNEGLLQNKSTESAADTPSLHQAHPLVNKMSNGVILEGKSLNIPVVKSTSSSKNLESKEEKFEKRVNFLEKYLAKLDKKIKKLQSKELSLDDLDKEDSTYILEDRYKKKFQKTWVTLCRIKKRSHLVGREIDRRFTYKGSRHDAINKAVEKLINKRKPTEKFPNYVEVFNLIQKVSADIHLSLGIGEIESEAREAFENVGIELKRRRQADEERDFGCYLTDNLHLQADPADVDEELNKKLSCSVVEGEKKIKEIIDKYASEQKEKAPGDQSVEDEGSDCEEPQNDEGNQHRDSLGEETTTGVDDLPDTDPASPDTNPATPETNPATPETNPATPETNPATPETNPATPETNPATPDTNPATPDTNPATPDTNPATPHTNPATPEKNPATPEKNPATPEKNPATQDTNPATPDTNPATPETNPATPETNLVTPETNPLIMETNPVTPDTDECSHKPEIIPNSEVTVSAPTEDVIDIGSSSDASTEPGLSVAPPPNTTYIPHEGIFINDEIEIVEDNQHCNSNSSPDLPSLSELCR